MKFRVACLMICALFVTEIALAQSTGTKLTPKRTIFNDADSFKNSVSLPKNVLDVLIASLKDDEHYSDLFVDKSNKELNEYFTAVLVHLSGFNEIDYVVQGNLPFAGADCGWYWIVRSARSHPEVVLFESTGTLELMRSRTNDYSDIRSVWQSPNERITRIYHYDGHSYVLAHKYDKDIRPKP
ncbi:MAG: hypothetical protein WAN35_02815 [Terracidiphilus sp.]